MQSLGNLEPRWRSASRPSRRPCRLGGRRPSSSVNGALATASPDAVDGPRSDRVPARLHESVLRRLESEAADERHRTRRRVGVLAAIGATVAGIAAAIALVVSSVPAPFGRVVALSGAPGTVASISLVPSTSGTDVVLHERGQPVGQDFVVTMKSSSGTWWQAGSYHTSGASVRAELTCAVPPSAITQIWVRNSTGRDGAEGLRELIHVTGRTTSSPRNDERGQAPSTTRTSAPHPRHSRTRGRAASRRRRSPARTPRSVRRCRRRGGPAPAPPRRAARPPRRPPSGAFVLPDLHLHPCPRLRRPSWPPRPRAPRHHRGSRCHPVHGRLVALDRDLGGGSIRVRVVVLSVDHSVGMDGSVPLPIGPSPRVAGWSPRPPHGSGRGADDPPGALAALLGSGQLVPCLGQVERIAVELDQAASTQAHPAVAERVAEFLPWYSSVHRGAGFRSRRATAAYEDARRAVLAFAGRDPDGPDVAILCRNTTEAINHLAYRLRLEPTDVVVTTVVEHHANLLPWGRVAQRRYVECGTRRDLHRGRRGGRPRRRTRPTRPCWPSPAPPTSRAGFRRIGAIIAAAHDRGVPVLVDAAQLAPHRPLPAEADFLALSGHKLYAPFGCGALIGPRAAVRDRRPVPGRRRRRRPGRTGRGDLDGTPRPRRGRFAQRRRGHRPPRGDRRAHRTRVGRHRGPRARAGRPAAPGSGRHRGRPPARPGRSRRRPTRPSSRWPRSPSTACTMRWWRPG